jgi:hypothetical protein
MKRTALLALLVLTLPLAAFANSKTWDFTNNDGTLMGTVAGLSLGNSELTVIHGPGGFAVGDLGTVAFTLGAFAGVGGLAKAGTFSNIGSTFTITSNGIGFPVIFSGTFTKPATWTPEGNGIYQLSGYVSGIVDGLAVKGFTSQLYVGVNAAGVFTGTFGSGDTIVSTPEPGTLGLLGTGLLGLAGVMHKKLKA